VCSWFSPVQAVDSCVKSLDFDKESVLTIPKRILTRQRILAQEGAPLINLLSPRTIPKKLSERFLHKESYLQKN